MGWNSFQCHSSEILYFEKPVFSNKRPWPRPETAWDIFSLLSERYLDEMLLLYARGSNDKLKIPGNCPFETHFPLFWLDKLKGSQKWLVQFCLRKDFDHESVSAIRRFQRLISWFSVKCFLLIRLYLVQTQIRQHNWLTFLFISLKTSFACPYTTYP